MFFGVLIAAGSAGAASPRSGDLPAWSPDGTKIAFVGPSLSNPAATEKATDSDYRVMVMTPSGSGRRAIISFDPGERAAELRWADQRHLIVSFSSAGALRDIDTTTGRAIELGASKFSPLSLAANETFTVSANGRLVACTADSPYANENVTRFDQTPDVFAIRVMSAAGGPSRVLPQPVHASDAYPSFSPDAKNVVFARSVLRHGNPTGPPSLMIQSVDGGQASLLTTNGDDPVWSPSGRWIAYQRIVRGATPGSFVPWTLQAIGRSGGQARTLLSSGIDESLALSWSPDSSRVAFITASGEMGTAALSGKVRIFSLHGLSFESAVPGTPPQWSPDGRNLVFAASPTALPSVTAIYAIRADGHGLHRIG